MNLPLNQFKFQIMNKLTSRRSFIKTGTVAGVSA
ncbi:MAG: twin-arginine translocation signal domain-containing protein, partial [Chitinophagaceae bacterium]